MEKQKRPDINFHGPNQQWCENKLKNVSFKVIEKNLNNLYTETFTNSAQFGVVSQRDFFDKDISNSSSIKGYYVVKKNDFIYNPRISNYAPVGPIKRNKLGRIGVVSPLYFVFRVHDIDYQFLETYFESPKWHPFMLLSGDTGARSDRLAIKDSIFIEMPIYCPDEKIQKEIGNFFQNLDQSIALQEKKLAQTQNLKKAMLEKMFPKAGSKQPEIRLKGFGGEWELQPLENIFGKIRNAFVGTATPYYVKSGRFYLESNNVKDGKINRKSEIFINDYFYYKQQDKWLKTNDIVMVQSGHVGHAAVITEELNNSAAHALIMFTDYKVDADPHFINYQIQTYKVKNEIEKITTGNTIKHILSSDMKKFSLLFPSINEQFKIGNFFRQLDETLVLQQQQLQTLKNLKQAFLEKMFV